MNVLHVITRYGIYGLGDTLPHREGFYLIPDLLKLPVEVCLLPPLPVPCHGKNSGSSDFHVGNFSAFVCSGRLPGVFWDMQGLNKVLQIEIVFFVFFHEFQKQSSKQITHTKVGRTLEL